MTSTTSAPARIGGTRFRSIEPFTQSAEILIDYLASFGVDPDLARPAVSLILGTEVNHLSFRVSVDPIERADRAPRSGWLRIDWRTSAGERIVEIFG
jgi:hypothetical protein